MFFLNIGKDAGETGLLGATVPRRPVSFPGRPVPLGVGKRATSMQTLAKGIVYDAISVHHLLGRGVQISGDVPEAVNGEIAIYYGGWTLWELRTSPAGRTRMEQDQDWYDWNGWCAKAGY